MKTYSAQEFTKLFGKDAYQSFSGGQQSTRESISDVIARNFKSGINQVKEGFSQADASNPNNNVGTFFKGIGNIGSGAINTILSPISPATESTIGKATNFVANKISDIPAVQKFADTGAGQAIASGAQDVANYANIAGAVGGALEVPKVGSVVRDTSGNIVGKAQDALSTIKENASSYPKVIADKITNGKIDVKTQTILKETPSVTFDKYVQAGEQALTDPRKLTPLEIAGQKGEQVAQQLKDSLKQIGQKKADALASVKTVRLPDVAITQIDKLKSLLQTKLTDSERNLVNQLIDEYKTLGKNPTVGSVDSTIDKLQATLYEKSKGVAVPTTPRIQGIVNKSIGEVNSKLKSAVDNALGNTKYSDLNAMYAERVNTFNTLNKLLGEGGTKGGSLMKRFFSPQDAGIKSLFDTIKKEYGVDLGAEAQVAKFVMDTLGDTRARSLLSLPPTSKLGLINKGLDYVEKKLTSPENVLEKAKSMTKDFVNKVEKTPKQSLLEKYKNSKFGDQSGFVKNPFASDASKLQTQDTFQRLQAQKVKLLDQGLSENSPQIKNIIKAMKSLKK